MARYGNGELFWDTAEATARRWVLLLDGIRLASENQNHAAA